MAYNFANLRSEKLTSPEEEKVGEERQESGQQNLVGIWERLSWAIERDMPPKELCLCLRRVQAGDKLQMTPILEEMPEILGPEGKNRRDHSRGQQKPEREVPEENLAAPVAH